MTPANVQGVLVIENAGVVENAMLSYISIAWAQDRYFLDIGTIGDNIKMVQGMTTRYGDVNTPEIAGTCTPVHFQTYHFGPDFKYIIESGFTLGRAYKVSLCLSEIYNKACLSGKRKFSSVAINGQIVESGLDVAGTTGGCNKALVKSYKLDRQIRFKCSGQVRVSPQVNCEQWDGKLY